MFQEAVGVNLLLKLKSLLQFKCPGFPDSEGLMKALSELEAEQRVNDVIGSGCFQALCSEREEVKVTSKNKTGCKRYFTRLPPPLWGDVYIITDPPFHDPSHKRTPSGRLGRMCVQIPPSAQTLHQSWWLNFSNSFPLCLCTQAHKHRGKVTTAKGS